MRLDPTEARRRLEAARSARLATASASGVPHLVPITFAVDDDRLFFVIDHKPKTTANLRRLRNISENPHVSVLVDHYADDWEQLWWVRADGIAEVWHGGVERHRAVELLAAKYPQYRAAVPDGPVVVISLGQVTGWSYTD
ncbi:TIGR03668 family PPOX class F420-dependent oxidoreductase [Streptacidiphilus anmyonensis]|uniref:TIGR03668 family PPOX class F420-dependent oxidoreductase n=1 Tax=Streptacidiphilus anmyonensis TaxID=405782 RepID=UPI0005AB5D20|nr:TIGR03668 family PPOX class F420-dependent oxidoreductase [Streptacidiphilus anmyonensis]